MSIAEIKKDIFWVGAVDKEARNFHGHIYTTERGTTFNAYLILDDKPTLIDSVYGPFSDVMIEAIKQIIPIDEIEYIIVNHAEMDHSGALLHIIKACPKAKIFGTQKCQDALKRHYHLDFDFKAVKTNDKLSLGKKTLTFIEAPMLHWPDSMFTYLIEDAVLFPNDAFGQHYATDERFDDEVDETILMDEALKYYANILWPLSSLVLRKIEEVQKANIPISMIAPGHGIIWRKDPIRIVNAYLKWASNQTKQKAVVVCETMWGSTGKMAEAIAEGIREKEIDAKLFDINQTNPTEIIKEMFDAKGYIFGSSTHYTDMLPNIAGFLEFLKSLKPKNRVAAIFGSYGWSGGAEKAIERILTETGIEVIRPPLSFKYVPDQNELNRCREFGKDFADAL